MTAYCTPQDLVDRYGAAELAQLAPAAGGGTDAARVARACADAGDLVDGYLRPRHTLPLSAVPTILVRLSAAIARHDLHLGGDRQPTEQVRAERDAAIAFLKDVAAGRADLGLSAAGAEPAEDGSGVIVGRGAARGVTDAALDDYRRWGW